jgi:hypothetical protein
MRWLRKLVDPDDFQAKIAQLQADSDDRSRSLLQFLEDVSAEIGKLGEIQRVLATGPQEPDTVLLDRIRLIVDRQESGR